MAIALTVAYPFIMWFARQWVEPKWLSIILLLVAASRIPMLKYNRTAGISIIGALVLMATTVWSNTFLPMKLYPVVMNIAMFVLFALSLCFPPTIIERIARIREPNLSQRGVRYVTHVTIVWCVFFVINGSIAAWTVFFADDAIWSIYNGLIAYILMGLLFGIEYLCRIYVRSHEKRSNIS